MSLSHIFSSNAKPYNICLHLRSRLGNFPLYFTHFLKHLTLEFTCAKILLFFKKENELFKKIRLVFERVKERVKNYEFKFQSLNLLIFICFWLKFRTKKAPKSLKNKVFLNFFVYIVKTIYNFNKMSQ